MFASPAGHTRSLCRLLQKLSSTNALTYHSISKAEGTARRTVTLDLQTLPEVEPEEDVKVQKLGEENNTSSHLLPKHRAHGPEFQGSGSARI